MSHAIILLTAALLGAQPTAQIPSQSGSGRARTAASRSGPPPVEDPPRPGESARERALRRSKVPTYPGIDRPTVWIPAAVGVLFAGGAVTSYVTAASAHSKLERAQVLNRLEVEELASQGQTAQVLTWVLAGAALASWGFAAASFSQPASPATPAVSLAPVRGGGVLIFQGVLP